MGSRSRHMVVFSTVPFYSSRSGKHYHHHHHYQLLFYGAPIKWRPVLGTGKDLTFLDESDCALSKERPPPYLGQRRDER